ncbi:hypothetical protein [Neosynechococcus sphagnicola]|uniref:hypothetical protein n=1 Tax=Neosynechococcus sphagnicola TaxID=1501145 RepID=UPI000AB09B21|nr:hypothetical protein [Neosynechococcus sphagnicola]
MTTLPLTVQSIQTTSRAQLLRRVAAVIIQAVQAQEVQPQEIAVIGPGLDAIARYTLREILTHAGIPVISLQEQRSLASVPMIRGFLTLLALVYPGLGRLADRDSVAEMLVVLSPEIDPVRAGLLADHCFQPDLELPSLLPVRAFPRWDRLGYAATTAYDTLVAWLENQRQQYHQHLIPTPVAVLDRVVQLQLSNRGTLSADQMAALRELLETAQHYWEVDSRLQQWEVNPSTPTHRIAAFIQLLRNGTVTANPYPVSPLDAGRGAVTLATVFQYRSSRVAHSWQFWLDAGSQRWLTGTDALFGSALFLQERLGQPWTATEAEAAYLQRLRRIVLDLLGRAGEQIFLCHSDLATNGQEQTGPLLPLVNVSMPMAVEGTPA